MAATGRIVELWRHPLKGIGAERLAETTLAAGQTLPGDRLWALAHEKSRIDPANPVWTPAWTWWTTARAPAFAAVRVRLDDAAGRVTLEHPERPPLTFRPDDPAELSRFLAWIEPLRPARGPRPTALIRLPGRGFTDTEYPSITLHSMASLRALSERVGQRLDPRRFRANIWFDGLPPWAELEWIGREITVGRARLRVVEPVERCHVPKANPETGRPDIDVLAALEAHYGHKDFGVYCEVVEGGRVAEGDPMVAP